MLEASTVCVKYLIQRRCIPWATDSGAVAHLIHQPFRGVFFRSHFVNNFAVQTETDVN